MAAFYASPVPAGDPADEAYLLKAAFIYNFAKFTRWPDTAWTDPSAPLQLCTVGKDDLTLSLARLSNETIRGRAVAIRVVGVSDEIEGCHVLYVAGSERRKAALWVEETDSAPVLTISEIRGFADNGGVIQLYHDKSRIRFKVNLDAAHQKQLKLSVRLLDLADVIDSGRAQ